MQKETRRNSAAGSAKPNPPRKLTRAEKKQIAEIIRQARKPRPSIRAQLKADKAKTAPKKAAAKTKNHDMEV